MPSLSRDEILRYRVNRLADVRRVGAHFDGQRRPQAVAIRFV
jgi:hypothetical protein